MGGGSDSTTFCYGSKRRFTMLKSTSHAIGLETDVQKSIKNKKGEEDGFFEQTAEWKFICVTLTGVHKKCVKI